MYNRQFSKYYWGTLTGGGESKIAFEWMEINAWCPNFSLLRIGCDDLLIDHNLFVVINVNEINIEIKLNYKQIYMEIA